MATLEYTILLMFFVIQIFVTVSIFQAIKQMKGTFLLGYELLRVSTETESKTISFALTSKTKNRHFTNLKETINKYLQKNNSAVVDFHILKDIVDRSLEAVENSISSRISAPLYIGLVASMFGVIAGLWSINSSTIQLDTIAPFLSSIKWAMSVSVSGLIFTLIVSVFIFRRDKEILDEGKNQFLSFLQTELLPKLSKSNNAEISKLNVRLDVFSRQAISLVDSLKDIVDRTSLSLLREQEMIQELGDLDLRKVSKVNIDIFYKLQEMMGSFEAFPAYYQELNNSLKQTGTLNRNLVELLAQKDTIPNVLDKIALIIESTKTSTDFFNENIKSFQRYGAAVQLSVANADDKMQLAIEQLTKVITTQLQAYQVAAISYEDKIDQAFEKSIHKYTETVDAQVERMAEAFEVGTPKFEKIGAIQDALEQLNKTLLLQTAEIKRSNRVEPKAETAESNAHNTSENGRWEKLWDIRTNIGLFLLFVGIALVVKYLF